MKNFRILLLVLAMTSYGMANGGIIITNRDTASTPKVDDPCVQAPKPGVGTVISHATGIIITNLTGILITNVFDSGAVDCGIIIIN